MITKIDDEVIARIISGDIIRFGTIIDVIIYYDNENDMFISEQTKIETPTYVTKHLTYIGKNKIKEHLEDLLSIGTLEWDNDEDF